MKTVKELLDSGVLETQEKWEEDFKLTLEEFQKLAQWLGSIWNEEFSEIEVYAKAVQIVPNMEKVAKFFKRPRAIIFFSAGIFADALEYSYEFARRFSKKEMENLKRDVRELKEYVEKVGFRVRHRILKPDHDEAVANEYESCDLQDMVLLLPEAEKIDKDSFYNHWGKMLKESTVTEIMDVMPEILESDVENALARWDEAFDELKARAPFEQIYAHLTDYVSTKAKHGHEIGKSSEGEYPEDYFAFKEHTWEMFKRLHSLLATFFPNMEMLLEAGREDAEKISGYRP